MLFDKNGYYLIPSNNQESDYDFAIDIINGMPPKKEELNTYNVDEALRLGNLFPKLYNPYKNYEPAYIRVDSAREKCLLEIQRLEFAIGDLNLYLDMHPDDRGCYELFKKYVKECKKLKKEYTAMYGPLSLSDLTDEWEWSKGVWPWEGRGM